MEQQRKMLFGLAMLSLFLGFFDLADSQCSDGHYHIDTVGCPFSTPNAFWADRGVPFFPECEENRDKCFSVITSDGNPVHVAIFLSETSMIRTTEANLYRIEIEVGGDVNLYRNDVMMAPTDPSATAPGGTIRDWCVSIDTDNTIHLSQQGGGYVLSWKDDNLIDVNFILVQRYNDPDESPTTFQFCDGAVKLLSQNGGGAQTVIPSMSFPPDEISGTADNAIDGDIPSTGKSNTDDCVSLLSESTYDYWRIDLQDLYEIKAVNIMDGFDDFGCPKGWLYHGYSCFWFSDYDGADPMEWADAQADCEDKDAHLATIRIPETQEFIDEYSTDMETYWIGLSGQGGDHWIGEVNVDFEEDGTYFRNGGGNPGGNQAVYTSRTGTNSIWTNNGRTNTHEYICQRPLCPVNWRLFGDTCYQYEEIGDSFTDITCTLVTFDSAYVEGAIDDWLDGLGEPRIWVGLSDIGHEGNFDWVEFPGDFVWVEGRPPTADDGHPVAGKYTNFDTNEPDDGNGPTDQDCVSFDQSNEAWDDDPCASANDYVCQIAPPAEVSELVGVSVHVGTCPATGAVTLDDIKANHECHSSIGGADLGPVGSPNWVLRECTADYYGRYVYILKESHTRPFNLCEVEVWGMEIADEDKPTVTLTSDTLEGLENDLATSSPLTVTATFSKGESSIDLCCDVSIQLSPESLFSDPATYDDTATAPFDENEDFETSPGPTPEPEPIIISFDSVNGYTDTFDVQVYNDFCTEPDESFGFEIDTDNLVCALAGDPIVFTIQNDDVTYCWQNTSLSVHENIGKVTVVLTRYGYTDSTTTAYIRTYGNGETPVPEPTPTAESNVDFVPISQNQPDGVITFGPGVTQIPIQLTINEDTDCETADDEIFILRFLEGDGLSEGKMCKDAASNDLEDVIITILHDDVVLQFQQAEYEVSETDGEIEVVVELRDGAVDRDITVDIRSQSTSTNPANPTDTADRGVDYMPSDIDRTVTIPAGRTSASFTLEVADDMDIEPDVETFELILVRSHLSLPECVVATPAAVKILDDDCNLSFDPSTLTLREGVDTAGVLTILCQRDTGSTATIHVPMNAELLISTNTILGQPTASDQTDYTVLRTSVALTGTSTDVTVFRLIDDILEETPEYLEVSLTAVDDGQIVPPVTVSVEIVDNDVTVQLASCGENSRVLESGNQITITVNRTGDLISSDSILILTIPVTAQPGSGSVRGDYVHVNKLLTFTAMQSIMTEDIIINDDNIPEVDEEFIVQIARQNGQTNVDTTLDICRVTILDDDCSFSLSVPDDVNIVPEGDTQISVDIHRTGNVDKGVSVTVETSRVAGGHPNEATADVDYPSFRRNVTFGPGDDSETVTVTITDDNIPEFTEYFEVIISAGGCQIGGGSQIFIGIEDDDGAVIRMRDPEITVFENEGSACPVVLRSGSLERTDVVSLSVTPIAIDGRSTAATPNSDFDDSDFTVTFNQNESEKEACVPIYNDDIEEIGLQSFSVAINSAEHRQARQASSGLLATIDDDNRRTIVFIRDDDGSLQLSCQNDRVSESSGSVTCTVERTGPTDQPQIAYVSTSNGNAASLSDYGPLSGISVSFPSGATSVPFTIKIFDDKELEGSEDFFVFLVANKGGPDLGQAADTITIIDDDNLVKFSTLSGVGQATDTTVTVDESIGRVRLTVLREAYGFNIPTGSTTVTVRSREINPGDAGRAIAADGGGVDYDDVNTEETFAVGQRRVDVEIKIIDDEIGERQEAFEVVLADAIPNANNFVVYPSLITIYINDDDGEPIDGQDGDGEEDSEGDGGTTLSQAAIVAIGGVVGLLLLLGVLGLIGCVAFSRWNQTRAAPSPARVTASRRPPAQYGAPRGPPTIQQPPPYYNPYVRDGGRGPRGQPPTYYR